MNRSTTNHPMQRRPRVGYLCFSISSQEYDELKKALGGQRTLLDKKRGVSNEPEDVHNHQNIQYYGLLTVRTPEKEIRVIYEGNSTDLRVPNFGCFGRSSEHNFHHGTQPNTYTIKHNIFSIRRGYGPVAVSLTKDGEQTPREASRRAQSRCQQIRWNDIQAFVTVMATKKCRRSA